MRIGWYFKPDDKIASYRYRTKIPIQELTRMGYDVGLGEGDVTIFQKHFYPSYIDSAKTIKSKGKKIIFDICDNHFGGDQFENYYVQMCEIADLVTCTTIGLQKLIKQYTGKDSIIILDPYEFDEAEASIPSGKVKNVLWFGSSTNIEPLLQTTIWFQNLRIVSNMVVVPKNVQNISTTKSTKWNKNGTSMEFFKWNLDEMPDHFKWCDIVIIPVFDTLKYHVKGANRMVESIRQGRFVVANHMPSYEGLGMWTGDIKEGTKWINEHIDECIENIRKSQKIVREKYNPETISMRWWEIANNLLGV